MERNDHLSTKSPTQRAARSRPASRWILYGLLLVIWIGLLVWLPFGLTPVGEAAVAQETQVADQPTVPAPTLDPEWVANTSQTNGIILGAAILVLIIVGGTLTTVRLKSRS